MKRSRSHLGMMALALLSGCAMPKTRPINLRAVPPADTLAWRDSPVSPPPTMQYLYGSGEAGALSVQAYQALVRYVATKVKKRPKDSVVLTDGATLTDPNFVSCDAKPYAAIFDIDETLILNLGVEEKAARADPTHFDAAQWDRWEKTGSHAVAAVPGATSAVGALRALGVTVIFNSNRAATHADGAINALAFAGLGQAVHGETLFLKGDDTTGSAKDTRRLKIADRYCVIAMGGDQLGDFSDLFNVRLAPPARRSAAVTGLLSTLWGNGWFVLPNPVYGSALSGGYDDVFPIDKRWTDPGAPKE